VIASLTLPTTGSADDAGNAIAPCMVNQAMIYAIT
jgi:hypothetical protein